MAKSYRPAGVGMIPAERGTYLVHAYFDDSQVDLVRANVVGWQVSSERILTPLVVDQRAAEDDPWFVIHPDERVECSDGRCWSDVDTWIAEERRRRRDAIAEGRLGFVDHDAQEDCHGGEKAMSELAPPARPRAPEDAPSAHPIPQAMPDPEPVPEAEPDDIPPRHARWM